MPDKSYLFGREAIIENYKKTDLISVPFLDFDFDPQQEVRKTLGDDANHFDMSNLGGVNSPDFIENTRSLKSTVIIYSGAAGVLVSGDLIAACRGVIHVHGGYLPDYRGSTCNYYSILDDFTVGASAIFLNEDLDQGNIIARTKMSPIKGIDLDYVLDPLLRAYVLIQALDVIASKKTGGKALVQNPTDGNTYQVIHPVLKHIALKKLGLTQ